MLPTDLDPIDDICSRGIVKDGDITRLRRTVYGSHGIATADIETLFRINKTTRVQDPAWAPFFIEAVTDYIVNELPPQGYVTADNARWLVGQISKDGRIANAAELELLVNVLDQARWVPESLARLALDQVVLAVTSGTGPLRDGRRLAPGHVTVDDVTLLRRVLYAFGGDGSAAVTRSEAEALLAIEEATADGSQAPEWRAVRQGDRRRDDGKLGLQGPRPRGGPAAGAVAAAARRPVDRQLHRPHPRRLRDPDGAGARPCPPGAAAHRDHHQRAGERGRGGVAQQARRARWPISRLRPSSGRKAGAFTRLCRGLPTRPPRPLDRP